MVVVEGETGEWSTGGGGHRLWEPAVDGRD